MGTLGTYLSSAREAKGIDLHDAAQQTRINVHYLKAMEEEDFSRLPGEVFVRGFLKSYARFLNLDEGEVMKRYQALKPQPQPPSVAAEKPAEAKTAVSPRPREKELPLEPLIWGAVIVIALVIFLFVSLPAKHKTVSRPGTPPPVEAKHEAAPVQPPKPEKLYLEIVALEDVWILVRTDTSPQKKAVLKKGENVIWSAEERFLLSYGGAGAVKLLLNGQELLVKAPKNAVVRDLIVTATGIATQKIQTEQQPKPAKPKPQAQPPAPVPPPAPAPPPQPEPEPASPEQPAVSPPPLGQPQE